MPLCNTSACLTARLLTFSALSQRMWQIANFVSLWHGGRSRYSVQYGILVFMGLLPDLKTIKWPNFSRMISSGESSGFPIIWRDAVTPFPVVTLPVSTVSFPRILDSSCAVVSAAGDT